MNNIARLYRIMIFVQTSCQLKRARTFVSFSTAKLSAQNEPRKLLWSWTSANTSVVQFTGAPILKKWLYLYMALNIDLFWTQKLYSFWFFSAFCRGLVRADADLEVTTVATGTICEAQQVFELVLISMAGRSRPLDALAFANPLFNSTSALQEIVYLHLCVVLHMKMIKMKHGEETLRPLLTFDIDQCRQ